MTQSRLVAWPERTAICVCEAVTPVKISVSALSSKPLELIVIRRHHHRVFTYVEDVIAETYGVIALFDRSADRRLQTHIGVAAE